MLNQRIIYKEDIKFVTEFIYLLCHPVDINSHNFNNVLLMLGTFQNAFSQMAYVPRVFFHVEISQICNFLSNNFSNLSQLQRSAPSLFKLLCLPS